MQFEIWAKNEKKALAKPKDQKKTETKFIHAFLAFRSFLNELFIPTLIQLFQKTQPLQTDLIVCSFILSITKLKISFAVCIEFGFMFNNFATFLSCATTHWPICSDCTHLSLHWCGHCIHKSSSCPMQIFIFMIFGFFLISRQIFYIFSAKFLSYPPL